MAIKVLVASRKEVKKLSAMDAFKTFSGQKAEFYLSDAEVPTGVSDQPMSLFETAQGALNRLEHIRGQEGYDYYVAIEGGAYEVELPTGIVWFESACAAVVTKDRRQKPSVAFSPAYPIPEAIMVHLRAGKDLNAAMEIETGVKDVGKKGGFNGWLTQEQLDRRKGSGLAVLVALHGLKHV